ncbi:MFS transporter [Anoxybacteroides tepidamans]|uniref:MFS transporter n=1 Tax=Anoxybacteroides tepidamans TaxID=265948 RepID=UPI0004873A0A|nr:MFS transporter [Anoxybacillus tepidamans]
MGRSFYALLVSQTAANLCFAFYTMVIVMHLYNETGSTTLSAAATTISMIARIASSTLLPTISDRFKPTKLLMLAQWAQLGFLAILIFFVFQNISALLLILTFVVMALISFFNGFFSPMKGVIVRAVVPENERIRANSLISSIDQTFLFASWTFCGLLLSVIGKEATLMLASSLLLLSIGSLYTIQLKESSQIEGQESLFNRLTGGWTYLFQHRGLRVIIAMDVMESLVGTIWMGAVTLTYVKEVLGKAETWWGYINGAYYFGTIIGGLIVYRLSKMMRGRLVSSMIAGSFLFGLFTLIYGLVSNPYFALLLVLVMGPSYQIRDLAQETMLQNSADEKTLAKILAARSALVQLVMLLSTITIGALVDMVGVRFIYIFSGCLLLFSTSFGFIYLHMRKFGQLLESEHIKV